MENIRNSARNSFRQSMETISKTPIGNIVNERSFSLEEPSESRMAIVKKIVFWIFIILILAFLGFNIFQYLAQGTDLLTALLSPFTAVMALITGDTAKTTLKYTSDGSQKIVTESSNFLQVFLNFLQVVLKFLTDLFNNSVKFVANTSTSAIDYLQSNIKKDKITYSKEDKKEEEDKNEDKNEESINEERKIEKRVTNVDNDIKKLIVKKEENEPEPSESNSQQHGFCYIGKVNNSRYCAKVSSKNKCMSGDIFPTMDLCINPKLRS